MATRKNTHTVYLNDSDFRKFQKLAKREGRTQARTFRDLLDAYESQQRALKEKGVK